jgi:fructose-bisphosphate aldolase class 1
LQIRLALLSSIIAVALVTAGSLGYIVGINNNQKLQQQYRTTMMTTAATEKQQISDAQLLTENSISTALKNDKVIIQIHDSAGNLKSE